MTTFHNPIAGANRKAIEINDLITKKGVDHPENTGGTHFKVYFHSEIKIVEKIAHDSHVMESVLLARNKLGGLVVPFVIDPNDPLRLFQKSVPSLLTVLEGSPTNSEELLTQYFENIRAMQRIGVFSWDSKVENFGVYKGKVLLIDLGGLKDSESVIVNEEENMVGDGDDSDIAFSALTEKIKLPQRYADLYRKLQKKYEVDNGQTKLNSLRSDLLKRDRPVFVTW